MTESSLDPQLATRARGALLGLVAGNQLGVPTEHLGTPEAIREAYPHGVWDLPAPPKGSPYDDDAALTLLLAESLVERADFDAADVAQRWVRWMKLDGRGLGVTTRNALRMIDRGVEPFEAGRQAHALNPKSSAGNGAIMRCAPVAIRFHDNIDKLSRASTQQAAITHADERCLWGAAAVNLAIRELLYGNIYFLDEVLHRLRDRAPRVLLEALHRVLREDQAALPVVVPGETGYVVHCVEIAFWFATHDRTLEDALVYLAQAGGDTDTNAAVTRALLGARYGETALPQRWMAQLVGVQGMLRLADRLLQPPPHGPRRSQSLRAEGARQIELQSLDELRPAEIAEGHHRDPPLQDVGAQVEPGTVRGIADQAAAFHQLRGLGGSVAHQRIAALQRPGARREVPVGHARGEAAITRSRGAGRGGLGGEQQRHQQRDRPSPRVSERSHGANIGKNGPGGASRAVPPPDLRPCERSALASPSDPERPRTPRCRPRRGCGSPRPGSP